MKKYLFMLATVVVSIFATTSFTSCTTESVEINASIGISGDGASTWVASLSAERKATIQTALATAAAKANGYSIDNATAAAAAVKAELKTQLKNTLTTDELNTCKTNNYIWTIALVKTGESTPLATETLPSTDL